MKSCPRQTCPHIPVPKAFSPFSKGNLLHGKDLCKGPPQVSKATAANRSVFYLRETLRRTFEVSVSVIVTVTPVYAPSGISVITLPKMAQPAAAV